MRPWYFGMNVDSALGNYVKINNVKNIGIVQSLRVYNEHLNEPQYFFYRLIEKFRKPGLNWKHAWVVKTPHDASIGLTQEY